MIPKSGSMISSVLFCKQDEMAIFYVQDSMEVLEAVLDARTATIAFRPDSCGELMET